MSIYETLSTSDRSYLVNNKGEQVPIDFLKGKYVGLYFSAHWCPPCRRFTPLLKQAYESLKADNKDFEVVFVSSDNDDQAFDDYFGEMPWLALPYSERDLKQSLAQQFGVNGIPSLALIDPQGATVRTDARNPVWEFGASAFPFTKEAEATAKAEKEKKKLEQFSKLSFNSLFSSESRDYLIDNKDNKVSVNSLSGKTVGIYFSAHWCGPCRGFTPKLIEIYNKLKADNKQFEIVFVSRDQDEDSFKSYFGEMPWLALPLNDPKGGEMDELFEVEGIPTLVMLDENAKVLSADCASDARKYGVEAFPWSTTLIQEFKEKATAAAREKYSKYAEEVKTALHEHPLKLLTSVYRGQYGCDSCGEGGEGYVYHCEECGFDLHPDCAVKAIEG